MAQAISRVTGEQRGVRKPLAVSLLLVVSSLSLFMAQGNCMEVSRRKRNRDPCPKLEFLSSSGCRPCSLCDPDEPNFYDLLIRDDCKQKHIGITHEGQKLWCDNSRGPFPECPTIREDKLRNCTTACQTYGRRFAPGCQCHVGCPGNQESVMVTCTQDLVWSRNPTPCLPSTTSGLDRLTDAPENAAEKPVISWKWIVVSMSCGLVVVVAGVIVFYCLYKKQKENMSSSTSSSCSSDKSDRTEKPLLGLERVGERLSAAGSGKVESYSNAQLASQLSLSLSQRSGTPEVPVAEISRHVNGNDRAPERQALLGGALRTPLGFGDGPAESRRTASQLALQALLHDRQALIKMMGLFDQKNHFDKVTWHNVAIEFAGWDVDKVNNTEYMMSPSADCSPADGFIYKVLDQAHQSGKGLLELLEHLENRQHVRHPKAEQFLHAFWDNWEEKNSAALGNAASC